jgi:hypothetical protein
VKDTVRSSYRLLLQDAQGDGVAHLQRCQVREFVRVLGEYLAIGFAHQITWKVGLRGWCESCGGAALLLETGIS